MRPSILIVDDDATIRTSLMQALERDGMYVRAAESAERALALLPDATPHIVLSDVKMPGLDGIELLRLLRERLPSAAVILMTAYDDMPTVVAAMREGAADFLSKPLDLEELRAVLSRVLADRRARERVERQAEDEAAPYRMDQLIGRDSRMIDAYKLVGQLAANRAIVLIRGETGTGKELIARAIHYNSPDADEPFLPVNCTAIPQTLLEAELFGHVRGAFTGAVSDRRGRFSLAAHGTVFLDEIGDTTPEFQAKLLRVLENHEFHPLGAEQPERSDARVIAATHRDLEALVAKGTFRQDLYYRLRVVDIVVPPLRERMGDLPALTEHLVRRAATDLHRPRPLITREAMDVLLRHDWPGNVRELENTLTRAVVLATGDVIRPEHVRAPTNHVTPSDGVESLADVERRQVQRALASSGGNKTKAAAMLGVSRPRLNRLIARYGLE
jgi:DNA-binding NtrC family response regulator